VDPDATRGADHEYIFEWSDLCPPIDLVRRGDGVADDGNFGRAFVERQLRRNRNQVALWQHEVLGVPTVDLPTDVATRPLTQRFAHRQAIATAAQNK